MPKRERVNLQPKTPELQDLAVALHQAEETARVEHSSSPVFALEWAVATAVGAAFIQRTVVSDILETHPDFTSEYILETWQMFMDNGFVAAESILENLQQPAPPRVIIEFDTPAASGKGRRIISRIAHTSGVVESLNFHIVALVGLFLPFLFTKQEFHRVYILKKFEAILAHEFYHIFQINRFPGLMKRERAKEYIDRRFEYGARLYSLRHLRRQTAQTSAEKLGLWRSRAHVLTSHLPEQSHVRDEMNSLFGVPKPGIKEFLRAIFVDDPKRNKRKLR